MTSRLPYDIQSLLPGHKGTPAKELEIGEPAPMIEGVSYVANPHIVSFVRHVGCPFGEWEVKSLARVQKKYSNVYIIIISHSEQSVVDDWFERIGKSNFSDLDKVKVIGDPKYEIYDKFGIGQLGWGGLFSYSMISELRKLAAQGIKNTTTGAGSNRWQNSGGFCVDHGGVVRWKKIAKNAGDTCNFEEAIKTIA